MEICSELNMCVGFLLCFGSFLFFVFVFGILSYSESFSFQAWEKKFLEKNPMSLLMIWVSIRILMDFYNLSCTILIFNLYHEINVNNKFEC